MPQKIEDLLRKLELLRAYGPRTTAAEQAEEFGCSWDTVQWWANGNSTRGKNLVPVKHLAVLRRLFAEALPSNVDDDEIDRLMRGRARTLEEILASESGPSIEDVIAEACIGTGKLHRPGLKLVEQVRVNDNPAVKLGEAFYLEFAAGKSGYALVLQHAQQAWGTVPFANGKVSLSVKPGSVAVPGIDRGERIDIYERTMPGEHRFLLFISPAPFPRSVLRPAAAGTALDWFMLSGLARHYLAQPDHLREVHLLKMQVEPASDPAPR